MWGAAAWEDSKGPSAKFTIFLPPTRPRFVLPLSTLHWHLGCHARTFVIKSCLWENIALLVL